MDPSNPKPPVKARPRPDRNRMPPPPRVPRLQQRPEPIELEAGDVEAGSVPAPSHERPTSRPPRRGK